MKKGAIALLIGLGGLVLYKTRTPQPVIDAIDEGIKNMGTYLRYQEYKQLVLDEMDRQGIPYELAPLVFGLIEQESDWKPDAYRYEAGINDASYGLMQILLKTAREMGFRGIPNDLFNPKINVEFGLKFLKSKLAQYDWNIEGAVIAYNAGHYHLGQAPTPYSIAVYAKANHYKTI